MIITLNISFVKTDELFFPGNHTRNRLKENNDKQEKTVEMLPSGLLMHYHSKAAYNGGNV